MAYLEDSYTYKIQKKIARDTMYTYNSKKHSRARQNSKENSKRQWRQQPAVLQRSTGQNSKENSKVQLFCVPVHRFARRAQNSKENSKFGLRYLSTCQHWGLQNSKENSKKTGVGEGEKGTRLLEDKIQKKIASLPPEFQS